MNLSINGKQVPLNNNLPLEDLIKHVTGRETQSGVAVAINGELIKRNDWNIVTLHENDQIEIIQAVAGG